MTKNQEQVVGITEEQKKQINENIRLFFTSIFPEVDLAGVRMFGYCKDGKLLEAVWTNEPIETTTETRTN